MGGAGAPTGCVYVCVCVLLTYWRPERTDGVILIPVQRTGDLSLRKKKCFHSSLKARKKQCPNMKAGRQAGRRSPSSSGMGQPVGSM